MPLDDEIIEENPPESEEGISDNPTDYPIDTDDPEVDGDDSLVQDEELGSTAPDGEQSEPDEFPEEEFEEFPEDELEEFPEDEWEEFPEDELEEFPEKEFEKFPEDELEEFPEDKLEDDLEFLPGEFPEKEYVLPADETVSDISLENQETEVSYYSDSEIVEIYTDLEAFEASTIQVDLYQYTILNRLEFIQYALCIVIALLFLQIFVRYKK